MREVGVRHHIDSDQPILPVVYRITDHTERGLRGHVCSLECRPVYVLDDEEAG